MSTLIEEKIEELFQRLAGSDAPIPKQIVIMELASQQTDEHGRLIVSMSSLRTPEEYEPRFEEVVAQGYAWLNLSYYGLLDGKGLIVVEVPGAPPPTPCRETSINFSGPTQRVAAAGWDVRVELIFR